MLTSLNRRRVLASGVCAATLAVTLGATRATHHRTTATALACGTAITHSGTVTLAADLEGCTGAGISITADHVTLNLNGHEISGTTNLFGVNVEADNVVVENGSIDAFSDGVLVNGSSVRVQNIRTWDDPDAGVKLRGDHDVLTGSTVFRSGVGIVAEQGAGDEVTNDAAPQNVDAGIDVDADATLVSGTRALGTSQGDGIDVTAERVQITGDIANGNTGDGIDAGQDTETLSKDTASFNTRLGIAASGGVTDGGSNHATGNGSLHQCSNVVCS